MRPQARLAFFVERGVRVAVDIPSGLSCDTGQVLGVAVEAHVTVTLAFLKLGLCVAPGFARAGQVHVAEIGIPADRLGVNVEYLNSRNPRNVRAAFELADELGRLLGAAPV